MDGISGEQVNYTYDALNRLASAETTYQANVPQWGQSYTYDGFGNLTAQTVTQGSAPAFSAVYDPSTNHPAAGFGSVDANGNLLLYADGGIVAYDGRNRMTGVNSNYQYSYDPSNKRVWRGVWTNGTLTTDEVTFWSVSGQKLATYQMNVTQNVNPPVMYASQTGTNYYFGAKLIKNAGGYVGADRLGSIGHFYPWGQEKPSATQNGTEKFTGYFRDAETGLDYADQRYHNPGTGRFLTPDPYQNSAGPGDPGSWNRYAYTRGDPVNRIDPSGQDDCDPGDPLPCAITIDYPGDVSFNDSIAAQIQNAIAAAATQIAAQLAELQQQLQQSCGLTLLGNLQTFLQTNDAAALTWDPTLALDLFTTGQSDNVDPRLMASILTLESGHGTTFGGTNNPFGLGPGNSYGTPQTAVGAEGSTLQKFIYTYHETSVSALYSGNGFKTLPKKPWIVIQYPAYCYGGKDGSQTSACQTAGQTISGFLSSQAGNPAVGLTPGNPNNLGFPCPQ